MLFITPAILLGYLISGSATLAKPSGWKPTGTGATTVVTDASAATNLGTKTVCIVGPGTTWGTTHPGATFTSVVAILPPPTSTGVAIGTTLDHSDHSHEARAATTSATRAIGSSSRQSTGVGHTTTTKKRAAARHEAAFVDFLPPPGDVATSTIWPWRDATSPPREDPPVTSPALPWHTTMFYRLAVTDASGATTVFAPIPSTSLGDGAWCDFVEVDETTVSEISTATSSTATATPITTSAIIQELNKSSGAASTSSELSFATFIAGGLFGVVVGLL